MFIVFFPFVHNYMLSYKILYRSTWYYCENGQAFFLFYFFVFALANLTLIDNEIFFLHKLTLGRTFV